MNGLISLRTIGIGSGAAPVLANSRSYIGRHARRGICLFDGQWIGGWDVWFNRSKALGPWV
jgi:hypothetical protein